MSRISEAQQLSIAPLNPLHVLGDTRSRAAQVAHALEAKSKPVKDDAAVARGLLEDVEIRAWVNESVTLTQNALPEEADYIASTAEALGVEFEALFLSQHRGLFDFKKGAAAPSQEALESAGDDCTVGGARLPAGQAWVVKNRDNVPDGRDIVVQHTDHRWGHSVIGQSNYGGSMAGSSGMNTRGLSIVLTRTVTINPPPGIHRGSLMSAMLAECATVKDAVSMALGLPHLGGTITLGDAEGNLATIELEPDAVSVEWASSRNWLAKTNHAEARSSAAAFASRAGNYMESSIARLASMQQIMAEAGAAEGEWADIEAWMVRQMSNHDGEGAVCRHGDSPTLNTAIMLSNPPTLLVSEGPPCEGQWKRWNAHLVEAA